MSDMLTQATQEPDQNCLVAQKILGTGRLDQVDPKMPSPNEQCSICFSGEKRKYNKQNYGDEGG
jgi:hypothetical protein